MVDARKENLVPDGILIDRARPRHFYYDGSKWSNQKYYIEIWLEKDALSSFFLPICRRYNLNLVICKGYPSYTIIKEFLDRSENYEEKEMKILYFGDFDPSGEDISRHIDDECGTEIEVIKCALKEEHIERYNLPPMMTKPKDTRTKGFVEKYGDIAVELDALNPEQLQEIVKEEVLKYVDELERAREELEQKRRSKANSFAKSVFNDVASAWSESVSVIENEAYEYIVYTDEDLENAKNCILEGRSVDFRYSVEEVKKELLWCIREQFVKIAEKVEKAIENLG